MTMLIKLDQGVPSGAPVTEENFRQVFADKNLPTLLTPEAVEPLGYGLYDFSNKPELGRYEKAVEVAPVKNTSGIWRQTWQVASMTDAEKQETDDLKAQQVRGLRAHFLYAADWTQLTDAPLSTEKKAEWATYRQALRDVPSQAGFPWEVTWPTQPV